MPTKSTYLSIQYIKDVAQVSFAKSDLDLHVVQDIQTNLDTLVNDLDQPKVLIDLTGLNYLPTIALGMLVAILTKVLRKGGKLRLCGLSPNIRELIAIGQLDRIFDIYPDREAGMAKF